MPASMAMIGAVPVEGGVRFRVWAPRVGRLELELLDPERRLPLPRDAAGYFELTVPGLTAGARYQYVLDGERRRPDPASRSQPDGVHGPSQVVDPASFVWRHPPPARALADLVLYELHVGTFTRQGTFDAAAAELSRLRDLGVTAVELMPVGAFPGRRNWGYDGVHWFAPQASYGGPEGLARFVDAAHGLGLSVVLDVVYNHLGPEGNYLSEYGPYFTHRHTTPWGDALDYDGPTAQPVRAHVLENVRLWLEDYRLDALRLDAVHAIIDDSPRHLVAELTAHAHALGATLGRRVHVIAESDLGDARVIEPASVHPRGWGCDAQWADDLHHALHAAITGETQGYYRDFGEIATLCRALTDGFSQTGLPSLFRGRPFGTPAKHLPGERFVVCSQNHDQVGNRARGERLAHLVPGCEHAAAALVLCAPAVPLVFQGEEHADPAPFLYFTDHSDPALQRAVSEGRRREFRQFGWAEVDVPDPQAPSTFERSVIDLGLGELGRHAGVRRFYQALLALRRESPSLRLLQHARTDAAGDESTRCLWLRRGSDEDETLVLVSLGRAPATLVAPAPRSGRWQLALDAGDPRFSGPPGARLREPWPERGALEVELPPFGVLVCTARRGD